jgi:geranylgeranyl diphosphate synthase, type II
MHSLDWELMVDTDLDLSLVVPASAARRVALIEAAKVSAMGAGLLPPLAFSELRKLGEAVLEAVNGEPHELAFAMLMCSNELWRPYFEATPYERRLLLLPQCLKNSASCVAVIDDLGLICAGCNRCNLNNFLEQAETLGYATLVAEGTSAALGLVEEGSVDAILGVSCMETLQKSFKHVLSSAIPSLAIPLLSDGCRDTTVDTTWLKHEIVAHNFQSNLQPLSVSKLKDKVEALFNPSFLAAEFHLNTNPNHTSRLAVDSLLHGGKRMRPLLSLLAYASYALEYNEQTARQLMLVVECFHKASLIHDDIEDGDDFRYGRKTVHHENGIPQAVNLGDYLIGQGYFKLSQLQLSAYIKAQLLDLFAHMHVESTIGQGEELISIEKHQIFSTEKIVELFRQKTGSAIRVSLVSGALAAGAPLHELELLGRFSDWFGIAYQIRDDLTEFLGEATDQERASYPFLKSLLAERTSLKSQTAEDWHEAIVQYRADEWAQNELDAVLFQVHNCLKLLESQKMRLALLSVVNRIFADK